MFYSMRDLEPLSILDPNPITSRGNRLSLIDPKNSGYLVLNILWFNYGLTLLKCLLHFKII